MTVAGIKVAMGMEMFLEQLHGDLKRGRYKPSPSLHRKRTRLVRLPSLLRPTRKLWREGNVEQFLLSMLRVERFRRGWMRAPAYIGVPGEPDA